MQHFRPCCPMPVDESVIVQRTSREVNVRNNITYRGKRCLWNVTVSDREWDQRTADTTQTQTTPHQSARSCVVHYVHYAINTAPFTDKLERKTFSIKPVSYTHLASRSLVEWADDNPNFLQNIVTGDESWCFQYDLSTKRQTAEWRDPGDGRPMNCLLYTSVSSCFPSFLNP